jgi:hypothetical protein
METDETLALDLMGIEEGTDKSTLVGGYLPHYDWLFRSLRHERFNLIEIGVFHGASTRMWRRYFTQAQIVGLDRDPRCLEHSGDRVRIEIGSQDDPEFLHRVAVDYPPWMVIDDGSHLADHMVLSFERLFPAVLSGGWYIVEDVHFHLQEPDAERLKGAGEVSVIDYFLAIVKDRMRSSRGVARLNGFRKYVVEAISRIVIIKGAIIINKVGNPDGDYYARVHRHLFFSGKGLDWLRYGLMLQAHQRPLPDVIAALQQSLALDASDLRTHNHLAEALFELGDRAGAAKVLEKAAATLPLDPAKAQAIQQRIRRYRDG